MCTACGAADQRCCADQQCSSGTCVEDFTGAGTCRTGCGAKGQSCCEIDIGGILQGAFPDAGVRIPNGGFPFNVDAGVDLSFLNMCSGELSCVGGKCGSCGADGEACCAPLDSCDDGLSCAQKKCQKCGQPGQACCAATGQSSDGCPGPLNVCQNGMCAGMTCGLLNETCCPGGADGGVGMCSAVGTVCSSGSCKACGGVGQPCCSGGGGAPTCSVRGAMCMTGTCKMP
jgi:hypothetical protein